MSVENEIVVSGGNPLDVPAADFAAALTRRSGNRTALMRWVKDSLVKGTDFGTIQIGGRESKESLWKPGAEKICGMLGLKAVFPTLPMYEEAAVKNLPIENIILRCHLVDASGAIVADGVGARSVSKDKGDINKALKMAAKSAHIDATLRCAGLSEVFTQDIEDMKPEPVTQLWPDKKTREKMSADILIAFREGNTAEVDRLLKSMTNEQGSDIWRDYDAPTRASIKRDIESYRSAMK